MTRKDHQPVMAQLARFIAVGTFCALLDFGVYWLLLHAGLWPHAAKALSFIAGTTTAYTLNRRITFTTTGSPTRAGGFALLYTVTFFVNVGVNALLLATLPTFPATFAVAWVVAQGTATAINFILLRTVVFR